jgi:hypothetical protein
MTTMKVVKLGPCAGVLALCQAVLAGGCTHAGDEAPYPDCTPPPTIAYADASDELKTIQLSDAIARLESAAGRWVVDAICAGTVGTAEIARAKAGLRTARRAV